MYEYNAERRIKIGRSAMQRDKKCGRIFLPSFFCFACWMGLSLTPWDTQIDRLIDTPRKAMGKGKKISTNPKAEGARAAKVRL
jgi:hypothetical protein